MAQVVQSSFRDPAGYVFIHNNNLYRAVSDWYRQDYDVLMQSGLYQNLVQDNLLVSHEGVMLSLQQKGIYKYLQPERVSFISYPYEWSFTQLQDAALLTLEIQRRALGHGMSLKDASAYNIQFCHGKPIFIDTLSFERVDERKPWVAYKQFCMHFLVPLALMSYVDIRLSQLLRIHVDGIPLDLASKLLPFRLRWLKPGLLIHLFLHARMQSRHEYDNEAVNFSKSISLSSRLGLIQSLRRCVEKLSWESRGNTEWADYYDGDSYSQVGFESKGKLVEQFYMISQAKTVWDLGANNGYYSDLVARHGAEVVSWDVDPSCVETSYHRIQKEERSNVLPLLLDLGNPSSNAGWAHEEHLGLTHRGPADMILALALIHHLRITVGIPLRKVAQFFSKLGSWLLIEFVPREDKKVRFLLRNRVDVFTDYQEEVFERTFCEWYQLIEKQCIDDSSRILYLFKTKRLCK